MAYASLYSHYIAKKLWNRRIYDLIPIIDWCKKIGFDIIQLLPLNDNGIDQSRRPRRSRAGERRRGIVGVGTVGVGHAAVAGRPGGAGEEDCRRPGLGSGLDLGIEVLVGERQE